MSKRVLIISTTLRGGGNSEVLADAFLNGAVEAGHEVDKICLDGNDLRFCVGCLSCQRTGKCVLRDGMGAILEKMLRADVLVFATPIYFYEMSGQMKTLLDRTNPLFAADYPFRDVYLLATAADGAESAMEGAIHGLQGWLDCFEKTRLAGVVRACGVTGAGEIKNDSAVLEQARQMGREA